jgi:hypothetical protein
MRYTKSRKTRTPNNLTNVESNETEGSKQDSQNLFLGSPMPEGGEP